MGSGSAAGRGHITNLRPFEQTATRHRRSLLDRLEEHEAVPVSRFRRPCHRLCDASNHEPAVEIDEGQRDPKGRERGVDVMRDAADPR